VSLRGSPSGAARRAGVPPSRESACTGRTEPLSRGCAPMGYLPGSAYSRNSRRRGREEQPAENPAPLTATGGPGSTPQGHQPAGLPLGSRQDRGTPRSAGRRGGALMPSSLTPHSPRYQLSGWGRCAIKFANTLASWGARRSTSGRWLGGEVPVAEWRSSGRPGRLPYTCRDWPAPAGGQGGSE
jgi:hypothetical protein